MVPLSGYVFVFGLSAVTCFVGLGRAVRIRDPGVRVGMIGLLGTSGGWAAAHVGYFLVPSMTAKYAFYVAGLVAGFAAVGAWLYFCSAYTGRTYHQQSVYRRLAVIAFGLVTLLKLTNPIHSSYFTVEAVAAPFPHLAVTHGSAHWVTMALAYALATVGFFMLFERFVAVGFDERPLAALVGITALPVGVTVLGTVSPALLNVTYEPVGVAIFAVGVLFAYFERFQAVNLAVGADAPVVFLDGEHRVRDYNQRASERFAALEGSLGTPIGDVSRRLAAGITAEGHVIEDVSGSDPRYSLVSVTPFTAAGATTGYLLTLTDVTERERYRRELERKTRTLEGFASVVSHDLRNPLSVAVGFTDLARRDPENAGNHLNRVADAHTRMTDLIEDLLTLAREGQAIKATEETSLSAVVERCWRGVETADATLVVADDVTLIADPDRLQQLLENLFRNVIEHAGADVTVTVGALANGFYVADDGPGIPPSERDDVFEFGYSTADGGTGFGLAIVSEIVTGHGWTISVGDGGRVGDGENVGDEANGGARFEIRGVDIVERATTTSDRDADRRDE